VVLPDPGGPNDNPINRCVILLAVAVTALLLYSFALPRLIPTRSDWLTAARTISTWLTAPTFALLVLIFVLETVERVQNAAVRIHPLAIVFVVIVLVAMCVTALTFALQPARDPLNLKNKGAYVYAAEAFIALIFVHIRLTAPWIFHHRSGDTGRSW
jgi:quinol-cytochrome oxidoreductase complex cytochrome b subunit